MTYKLCTESYQCSDARLMQSTSSSRNIYERS
uniref:Uncharacterized protein n=1 Tax=Setaria italica TaxID=4555 RepID=K4A421_SETIT